MQAYIAEFPVRLDGQPDQHVHDGGELLYLIRGRLKLQLESEVFDLSAGDSAYFDSSVPHSYRGPEESGTQALVVTNPPKAI